MAADEAPTRCSLCFHEFPDQGAVLAYCAKDAFTKDALSPKNWQNTSNIRDFLNTFCETTQGVQASPCTCDESPTPSVGTHWSLSIPAILACYYIY